jgi:hypothetical protein
MANGYTAPILAGDPDFTVYDYLMRVARGFGFAINQRDDPTDVPVRLDPVAPDTHYYDNEIKTARERLRGVAALSASDADREAEKEYDNALREYDAAVIENGLRRARYRAMIAAVEEWEADALLEPVRDAALRYLRESMEWDCPVPMRFPSRPERVTGSEWVRREVASARERLEYHGRARADEVARTEERNAWIAALDRSLRSERFGDSPIAAHPRAREGS